MQHGGQSFPMFDYDLAPYVRKTYEKHLAKIKQYPTTLTEEEIRERAWEETDNTLTKRAKPLYIMPTACIRGAADRFRLFQLITARIRQGKAAF